MKKLIILLLFIFSLNLFAKEKKYIYTLSPIKTPISYINKNKVIISSKSISISLKQIKKPAFAKKYPIFAKEPNTTFIYFQFSIKNNSKSDVQLDINFISLESNREYRKPLNYDQLYILINKLYPGSTPAGLLQKHLLDFISPVKPYENKKGILIFKNFREKAKNAIVKIDNVTVNNMPIGLKFPYNIERRKVIVE